MKNSNSSFLMLKTLSVLAFISTLFCVGIVFLKDEKSNKKNEIISIAKKNSLETKKNVSLYTVKSESIPLSNTSTIALKNTSSKNTSKIAHVENNVMLDKDSVARAIPIDVVMTTPSEIKLDEKILKNNIESETTKTSEVAIKKSALKVGGMTNFYKTVATKFDDDIIDDGAEEVKVLVSFAIEKNGEMTNIKVENNKNKYISKEAIRVLKSLKTKWEPATKNNEIVRAEYILPITVKSE